MSALLNLTRGYLTSLCSSVVAKLLITATKRTQNALTQGWWAQHRAEADSKPAKELFCAEVRLSRRGKGRKESTICTPGRVKTSVKCCLCSLLPHRGNDQLSPAPVAAQDARLVSFTAAERIHSPWKRPSVSRVRAGEELDSEG